MRIFTIFTTLFLMAGGAFAQTPKLYIHIVSHNEPTDNYDQPILYAKAKTKVLQMASIVDTKNVKWNLQTSDDFVFGARQDELSTGNNVFEMIAASPYSDNIEVDPRSKNNFGRNIADQWYLLDSLGANPTTTVGGFLWYICQPSAMQPDWWKYEDTITGLVYGNKVKFDLLSGAGSAGASLHCNDLNDFGIFKPDTVNNFYQHNPNRNLWCLGTGCAPVLDSLDDEQAIIDLIQAQVDSIQNGFWPANKFYLTRIMTNQREYGPMFFQKISKVIDSLNLISSTELEWATIGETFNAFENWQITSGLDHSQWLCGQTATGIESIRNTEFFKVFPNPTSSNFTILFEDAKQHLIQLYDITGQLLYQQISNSQIEIKMDENPCGIYLIKVDENAVWKVTKQ